MSVPQPELATALELTLDAIYAHDGPWTEADFMALPESNRRIELLDGAVVVSPSPRTWHQWLLAELLAAFNHVRPAHRGALPNVDVRVGAGRIFVPDLIVVDFPPPNRQIWDASEVHLALEIVSTGSKAMDRSIKPRLYAEAGIPVYVRVEMGDVPTALIGRLAGDGYVVGERSPVLRLTEPYPVRIDLPALLGMPPADS